MHLPGNRRRIQELVEQHYVSLYRYAFRLTGSASDAEDLTQETFLRAFRQLESFRSESKFSTWLCRIAINLSLTWRDRERRRGAVHTQWAEDSITDGKGAGKYPDPLSRQVQGALDKLPAKQRAAIVLTVYEERSHAEAAKILNCTEATVSWRVFAARRKLKRLLKGVSRE